MTNDCLWEFDKLWMKAKVYMQKAFEEDREYAEVRAADAEA